MPSKNEPKNKLSKLSVVTDNSVNERVGPAPADSTKSKSMELAALAESITDVRRELLEITSKLKDGISSAKRDFSRESQRMSDADIRRDVRVNGLVRRIDQLEADVHRFDELFASSSLKLSGVSMRADSANYSSETNTAVIEAVSASVDLLKTQVKDLDLTLQKIGRKSLTIRWASVIGMLSMLGVFGLYRVVALPDVASLEAVQREHHINIEEIVRYLQNQ